MLSISNSFSEFEMPLRFLRAGSIISGCFLGCKESDRFFLTTDGKWIKTVKDGIQYLEFRELFGG